MQNLDPEKIISKLKLDLGETDLEVFMKTRGTDEAYMKIPLEDIVDNVNLSVFNHKIQWKKKVDRPPRRKINYNTGSITRPYLRKTQPLNRDSSQGSSNTHHKKTRREDSEMQTDNNVMTVQPERRTANTSTQ